MAKKKTNNRLAYGLCKRFGIMLPDKATPKEAWDALKRETGITLMEAYTNPEYNGTMDKQGGLYACSNSEREWEHPDSYEAIESAVFDRISLYKRQLFARGKVVFSLNYNNSIYTIRLYGENYDYDFDVIFREDVE